MSLARKKRREYQKRWRDTPQGKLKRLLQLARSRAKQSGIEFSLRFKDLSIPTTCPVLDIPLHWGDLAKPDNRPTLDRVDNSKGYTKANTRIISWRANTLKRDATMAELAALLKYMVDHS